MGRIPYLQEMMPADLLAISLYRLRWYVRGLGGQSRSERDWHPEAQRSP